MIALASFGLILFLVLNAVWDPRGRARPTSIALIFWAIAVSAPVAIGGWSQPLGPGLGVVALAMLGVRLGGWAAFLTARRLAGRVNHVNARPLQWSAKPSSPRLVTLAVTGAASGLVALGIVAIQSGATSATHVLQNLSQSANSIAVARYAGEASAVVSALLAVLYAGSIAAGGLAASRAFSQDTGRKIDAFASIAPLTAGVAYSFVSTSRSAMLYCGLLWLAARLTMAAHLGGTELRLRIRSAIIAGGVAVAVGLLFVAGAHLRVGGTQGGELAALVNRKAVVAAFGHLPALSAWTLEANREGELWFRDSPQLGGSSANAVVQLLGGTSAQIGVYEEAVPVRNGVTSNVFTALRGVIEDFGLLAGLVCFASMAFLADTCYWTARKGSRSLVGYIVLLVWYSSVLWSHVVSLGTYVTMVIAWVVGGLALWSTLVAPSPFRRKHVAPADNRRPVPRKLPA